MALNPRLLRLATGGNSKCFIARVFAPAVPVVLVKTAKAIMVVQKWHPLGVRQDSRAVILKNPPTDSIRWSRQGCP